jgi:hypothetical protein
VLADGVAEMDKRLGATADEEGAATKQVAGFAHALREDKDLRQHDAAKQVGNFVGVDLVGLCLAAVDGFRVEDVSEDSAISPAGRSALSSARTRVHKRLTGTAPTF